MFNLEPKVTLNNYTSYMVGPWNRVFRDWGYPLLDVVQQDSGEWGVIQYYKTPVIPSMTPWNWMVTPQHRYALTHGSLRQFVDQCDLEKRYVWDQMEAREKQDAEDMRREELHMTDQQRRMYQVISQNPDLMERVAKNGLGEIGLKKLMRNIPKHKLRKGAKRVENP